jgi:hypothetical protein
MKELNIMSSKAIPTRLNQTDLALTNAASPDVADALAEYGCDAAYLDEGRARRTAARDALSNRDLLYGRQQELTRQAQEALRIARREYGSLVRIARAVFRDQPGLLVQLGISGATPRSLDNLLAAADTLFANAADPAVAAELTKHGYSPTGLAEVQAAFQALRAANEAQEIAKGATQQATQELHAAMAALDEWMSKFRSIARVALRDQPQFLEELGIRVRS